MFDIKTFMVWFGSSTSVRRDDELSRININKCFELLILSEFTRAGQKEEKYLVKKKIANFLLQWPAPIQSVSSLTSSINNLLPKLVLAAEELRRG